MSAIALLTEPGKLVGFLLLANPTALASAPSSSDCILSGVPTAPSLFEHPLGAFVQSHKNTEFLCHIEKRGERLVLVGRPSVENVLTVEVEPTGTGRWKASTNGEQHEGFCELARK
ncbi:hypothetical protein OPU71_14260 [Niveibacterium sp. 24ML]|uniref:hypothetical protein n=1 Tax=Niveibacterium sp. 24ML TaxID=2985512 RepID=UPI002270B894|nr:hypothetical protein [Niveibacterium sp. 24ML]MCX9157288.1 hypothetical protein [Niveibacterium sp. 24ML]